MNLFGELCLDKIGEAVKENAVTVKNRGYGKEIVVEAKMWDNNDITISVYNKETGKRYKLGMLKKSKFQPDNKKEEDTDLPF